MWEIILCNCGFDVGICFDGQEALERAESVASTSCFDRSGDAPNRWNRDGASAAFLWTALLVLTLISLAATIAHFDPQFFGTISPTPCSS
jgi:hypothetical protein